MKAIFFGLGSIGQRHCRNLYENFGDIEIFALRTSNKKLQFIDDDKVNTIHSLDQVVDIGPDIAFVTNPSSLHVPTAILAAKAGCHLFIEKPLSHNLEDLSRLKEIIEKKGLVAFVACNFRFHPVIIELKKIIENNVLGKIYFAKVECGSYFPDWHPWEDYADSYVGKKELGGGAILTCIHEIDYLYWFFGEPKSVYCIAGKQSDLQIDVEDTADILMTSEDGTIINLHLDLLQRPNVREIKIVSAGGTLIANLLENDVVLLSKDKTETIYKLEDYDINKMYVEELTYFMDCVANNSKETMNDLIEAERILRIALTALEGARAK